jgi:hypothetical protein
MFVIPMAGESSRFFQKGYKEPKFKLSIFDQTVFSKAVSSFENYFKTDDFLFITMEKYDAPSFVQKEVCKLGITSFNIVTLNHPTSGQAETVFLGTQGLSSSTSLFIFNIDTFRHQYKKPDFLQECDGYLEVFKGDGEHWSFIEPMDNIRVLRTAEKERISNLCSDGLYYFKEKNLFDESFYNEIMRGKSVNNECYIAPLYNYLIGNGKCIYYSCISCNDIDFCGTPDEYIHLLERR